MNKLIIHLNNSNKNEKLISKVQIKFHRIWLFRKYLNHDFYGININWKLTVMQISSSFKIDRSTTCEAN